ncbi:MAG: YraN family protein [Bryobacterales bacterium]|nr:YraN family protein [Bryobacterales bacterium]
MFLYRLFDYLRHRARLRRWDPGHAWGRRGEDLAHRFLQRKGYTIVARNYRTRSGSGEVDLIGWDGESIAFIEVKTRATEDYGAPERAVDPEKQRHILIAARDYLRRTDIDWDLARFDIVSVVLTSPPGIRLEKDAFSKQQGHWPVAV